MNPRLKQVLSCGTKLLLKNWKFLVVNIIGVMGLYLSYCVIEMSYEMTQGNIPTVYYNYIFVGGILFGMVIFYKLVDFNGYVMLYEIKNR